MKAKLIVFFSVLLFMISPFTVFADDYENLEGSSFDVVFVMDHSSSMEDSDKNQISLISAQMFVDLCSNSNSRIGYVGFTDKIKDKRPIQQIAGNTSFRNLFNNIEFVGGTNIALGLREAYNLFQSAKKSEYGNKQVVILFCDGNNYPTQNKTLAELDKETKEWATVLKSAGIEIFTIGFNYDNSMNIDFMKTLSSDINKFYEAKTVDEIPNIMSQIYINLFNGQSKHLGYYTANGQKQSVTVSLDDEMYEADIIFISTEYSIDNIEILNESGEQYGAGNIVEGNKYSFARINFPNSGEWKINFTGNIGDSISVDLIAIYDIPDFASVNVIFETNCDTVIYPENVKYGRTISAPQTPVKTDYIFGGWFTDETCNNAFDFNTPIKKDITLYAKWIMEVAGVYTVNFDMNGGKFLNPISVVSNGKIELPVKDDCRKIGHEFVGFFLDKNTTVPFDTNAEITDNITLYAKWKVVDSNILPAILSCAVLIIVFLFSIIGFPKFFIEKRKIASPFFKSIFSVIINLFLCITVYIFFYLYLIPVVFQFTISSRQMGDLNFDNIYIGCFIITGIILPFLYNLLFDYIIPCATDSSRACKKKQYPVFFWLSLVGLVFPVGLALIFGIDARSTVWLIVTYVVTYTLNFFLSALAVSSAMSKSFSFWG